MKSIDVQTRAALENRAAIAPVNLLWIEGKNRETGATEAIGFWNGLDTVDAQVINPNTGLPVTRTFNAAGALLDVPAIPMTSDLTARTIRIKLSQINDAVQNAVRGYDIRHARVEIFRGLLNVETMLPVGPALPRFVGWVNGAPITTPAVGEEGSISLDCVSYTRLLTKTNPLRRSDEQQRRRSGDRFRRYTDVAGEWLQDIHWGEEKK